MLDLDNTGLTDEEIALILPHVDRGLDEALTQSAEERAKALDLLEANPLASMLLREVQMHFKFSDKVCEWTDKDSPNCNETTRWVDDWLVDEDQ